MARGGLAKNYDKVEAYINRPKWSAGIDKLAADATGAAAKAVADAAQKGPGMFESVISGAKKYAMGSAQSWQGAGMGLWGAASGGFMKMAQAAGAYQPPTVGQRPVLAFTESGSADSYREQASIRRLSEDTGKRQLKVQERMESHLGKIANQQPVQAANFG